MNRNEILEFINQNPASSLATVDGNKPHVRGILVYSADEKGITFHTGNFKDLHRQLQSNPYVEFSFFNYQTNTQLRVRGTAVESNDLNLKKEIVSKREFLRPWIESNILGLEMLKVYTVTDIEAAIWNMESNFEPTKFIAL